MNRWRCGPSLLSFIASAFCISTTAQAFVHPGCLSTSADLERMSNKVAQSAQPWKASWDILIANSHAQLSYNPNPQPWICRGGACTSMGIYENYMTMAHDAAAAYQCALRYHISGNTNYANKSVQIMDAWSATLTNITGDSNWLLAGAGQGYQWACAAELMRNYGPWTNSGGFTTFQNWLLDRFYPGIRAFLQYHNGTCDSHYWANWDLFAMCSLISIGVVCDRQDIYDEVVDYYRNGVGSGAADHLAFFTHPGYLGQEQEAGRDQGHASLGSVLLGTFCEIAWNQGDDLYAHASNRLLSVSEYTSRYNVQPLAETVPYVTYINCEYEVQPQVSSGARGSLRAGMDLVFNHYVNRMGLSAPFTALAAAQVRPEGGGGDYGGTSGGFDQIGFTTLTHSRDPIATNSVPVPSLLVADVRNNTVILSWWGSAYASGYNVKRATSPGGPYTTIAAGLSPDRLSYTDVGLAQGTTYYYVVSAHLGGNETSNSAPLGVTANLRLSGPVIGSSGSYNDKGAVKELLFDEALGNFFDAASGSGQWAGLDLGVSNRVTEVRYGPRANFSGRMVGGQFQGANVADFSSGVVTLYTITNGPSYNTLTAQAITNTGSFRYVRYISPANGWCNAAELQFFGYPSPAHAPVAPTGLTAVAGDGKVDLSWNMTADTTSYTIKRAMASGGPYSVLATGVQTTAFSDLGAANHTTWYYVISAVNNTGESADSAEVSALPLPFYRLRHYYPLDSDANDCVGSNHGVVSGSPVYAGGRMEQSLVLNGTSTYVTLSQPLERRAFTDLTVMAWAFWAGGGAWQRVFDFGSGTSYYLFLTPRSGANMTRFAIKNGGAEQSLETAQTATGQWVHLAVTIGGDTGQLYVNGAAVATNTAMTINPSDFTMSANYLGDSQWTADPLFNGRIDDVRIYNYALAPSEIQAVYGGDWVPFPVWQARHFGSATNPSAGAVKDPDGDGYANLMEYALYQSPTNPNPGFAVRSGLTNLMGNTFLTLTHTKVIGAYDIAYDVEAAGTLPAVWAAGTSVVALAAATNDPGGFTQTVTLRDLAPVTAVSNRYLRLRVTLP